MGWPQAAQARVSCEGRLLARDAGLDCDCGHVDCCGFVASSIKHGSLRYALLCSFQLLLLVVYGQFSMEDAVDQFTSLPATLTVIDAAHNIIAMKYIVT